MSWGPLFSGRGGTLSVGAPADSAAQTPLATGSGLVVNIAKWEASPSNEVQESPTSAASPGVETAPGITKWEFSADIVAGGGLLVLDSSVAAVIVPGTLSSVKAFTGGSGTGAYFNGDVRWMSIGMPVDLNGKIICPCKGKGHRMYSLSAS